MSAGPRPGSTPMAVPRVVPTRHHIRFTGVRATPKPTMSWLRLSMMSGPEQPFEDARADIDAESLGEAEI